MKRISVVGVALVAAASLCMQAAAEQPRARSRATDPAKQSSTRTTTPPKKKSEQEKKPLELAWPVTGRKIVAPYGERRNPTTKTVTVHPGINIAARKGSDVRASAAGTISLVSWLPGYGTFVIVEHRDGYRTVYANLGSTTVAKGAKVRAGSRIGSIARSGSGFVHFQVWRDQTRLDPTRFLR
jgi:murein DD-endopeptidase MepM/ murein hydrolase activator NlpD